MKPFNPPLEVASCCGCFTFEQFEELEARGELADYHGEWKYDGRHYLLWVEPEHNYVTSRRISKRTKRFVEQQDSMPYVKNQKFPRSWQHAVFVGEFISPEDGTTSNEAVTAMKNGTALYRVYDLLRYGGSDLREKPDSQRHALMLRLLQDFCPPWMRPTHRNPCVGRLYRAMRVLNGEGLILKDPSAPYGKGWVKVKNEEPHDCFVIGAKMSSEGKNAAKGWIQGLEIAQYFPFSGADDIGADFKELISRGGNSYQLRHVGRVSGFSDQEREEITRNLKSIIKERRVMTVHAQFRFPSGLFRSPRFDCWRDDKDSTECLVRKG